MRIRKRQIDNLPHLYSRLVYFKFEVVRSAMVIIFLTPKNN